MNAYRLGELEAEKSRREKAKLAVNAREVNAGRRESVDQIPVIASITKIAEPLKPAKQPAPKANPAPRIRAEVAKAAGVSERGVQQAGFVAKAAPELAAKVESGDSTRGGRQAGHNTGRASPGATSAARTVTP